MSAEDNRRAIRSAFEAWQAGTGAIADVSAEDLVWRIEGRSLASREYGSRQAFIDEVLAPFASRFAYGERFRPVNIRSVLGDGDTAFYDSISFNDLWTRVPPGWSEGARPRLTRW